jgi:excisionase family DNA binding protein
MKMISVSEAAEGLGLSVQRVRALIAEGRLKAQKIARDWAIPESALAKITVHGKAGRPRKKAEGRAETKERR